MVLNLIVTASKNARGYVGIRTSGVTGASGKSQGLKPRTFMALNGMAEAMPFHNTFVVLGVS